MREIRGNLELLVEKLGSFGYEFWYPDQVLVGPDSDLDEKLKIIESEVGTVPVPVADFWRYVGSVDFCGHHSSWESDILPDPLVIFPIDVSVSELSDFVAEKKAGELYLGTGVFRIPVGPDAYHKAGISGGMWYGIEVPNEFDDPYLLEEDHETTFLEYLDIALRWGGFPGLEGQADVQHWPIADLIRGLKGKDG